MQGRYIGSRGQLTVTKSTGKHNSLPKPLAEGDPTDWFLKYDFFVLNNWGDEVKAKNLLILLEGKPLAVWLESSEEQ